VFFVNEEEQTILAKIALFRYYLIERSRLVFFYAFFKFFYAEFDFAAAEAYFRHVADFQVVSGLYVLAVYGNPAAVGGVFGDGAAFKYA